VRPKSVAREAQERGAIGGDRQQVTRLPIGGRRRRGDASMIDARGGPRGAIGSTLQPHGAPTSPLVSTTAPAAPLDRALLDVMSDAGVSGAQLDAELGRRDAPSRRALWEAATDLLGPGVGREVGIRLAEPRWVGPAGYAIRASASLADGLARLQRMSSAVLGGARLSVQQQADQVVLAINPVGRPWPGAAAEAIVLAALAAGHAQTGARAQRRELGRVLGDLARPTLRPRRRRPDQLEHARWQQLARGPHRDQCVDQRGRADRADQERRGRVVAPHHVAEQVVELRSPALIALRG